MKVPNWKGLKADLIFNGKKKLFKEIREHFVAKKIYCHAEDHGPE
jgi:hypothetical protein